MRWPGQLRAPGCPQKESTMTAASGTVRPGLSLGLTCTLATTRVPNDVFAQTFLAAGPRCAREPTDE